MSWKRPKTIKLYLHPPEAKKLITIWPDFKVVNACIKQSNNTIDQNYGIRFLFGNEASVPDWKKTGFQVMPDGIPIHTLKYTYDGFFIELESFCDWEKAPDTFVRVKVQNTARMNKKFVLGIMPRTGIDAYLYGITGDFYSSYRPLLEQWDMVRNTWRYQKVYLQDGHRKVFYNLPKESSPSWIRQNRTNVFSKNYLQVTTKIHGFSTKCFYFTMCDSETIKSVNGKVYDLCRDRTILRWQTELAKIKLMPRVESDSYRTMFYSLVCQCLQMFATNDDGLVMPRQGGRYWGIWPTEAIEFLMALDRIGLSDWSEKGYNFFKHCQILQGKDKGRFTGFDAPLWTNQTGAVLYGLAYHLRKTGKEKFNRWSESILSAIKWIEKQRNKTRNASVFKIGYGLFPTGTGHDWGIKARYWCFTDCYNYLGLSEMADTFAFFNAPPADRIKTYVFDYFKCLSKTVNQFCAKQKNRKEIFIPNVLEVDRFYPGLCPVNSSRQWTPSDIQNATYPPIGPYFADGPVNLFRAGIIKPKSKIFGRVERYFFNRGWMHNGLSGFMTDAQLLLGLQSDPWAGHTWYTSFSDLPWFYAWLKRGEREKAKRTLEAQIKYGMSPEYYMQERYADNDPAFCPWQPNASANGRLIMMLLDFFGYKTK